MLEHQPIHVKQSAQAKSLAPWSLKQWVGWLSLPTLGLGVWVLLLVWIQPDPWTWSWVKHNYWQPQVTWFLDMNKAMTTWPTWIWYNLTQLGDGLVMIPLALLFAYRKPQVAAAIWASVPIAALFASLGKHIFVMPRPAAVLDHEQFTIIGEVVSAHTSLPSGHSLTYATAFFTVLAILQPSPRSIVAKVSILALLLVLAILCLSRVAVGAHWPLDTLAGASLGALAGLVGAALTRCGTSKKCWWQRIYASPWRFYHLPVFAIWFFFLARLVVTLHSQQSALTLIDMMSMYAALGACLMLMYWPFSVSALNYQNT